MLGSLLVSAPPRAGTPGTPIRLKVGYHTAERVLTEVTRSLAQGTISIESKKALSPGTKFVFEIQSHELAEPVEIVGEVVASEPVPDGSFRLTIRYSQGPDRHALDSLLGAIFDAHKKEKIRQYPRIPISLPISEAGHPERRYHLRELSLGGVSIELEGHERLPEGIRAGAPFLLELKMFKSPLVLHGEILWVIDSSDIDRWVNPSFGGHFGKLRAETVLTLERLINLEELPPPPWHGVLSFGLEAIGRMP